MENEENTERRTENLIPFKPGESGNPNGRPRGSRNYSTIEREALIKLGEEKGMTPEEIETELIKVGFRNALKGDFKFYQDVQDRKHGKPQQGIDLNATIVKPLIKLDE